MSAAAEQAVQAFTHPKVRGCARALLKKVAELIPEGETMTPPLAIDELATQIGYYDQAVRKARDVLAVDVGVLRIVGGGRGRVASYELLALPGAGVNPALPLRADLQPVPRRPPDGPTLFDTPEADASADLRANNVGEKYRRWVRYVGDFHRRCHQALSNIGDFHRRWWKKVGTFHRRSLSAVDVDSRARPREIRRSKYEEVDRAREGPHELEPDELGLSVAVEGFLDWFEAEYATVHHGAQCTVVRAPDGGRITELLRRGRTVGRLHDLAALMWTLTTDGVIGSDRWYIAERVPVRNIWLLHRKADFLELELLRAEAADEGAAYTCPHTDPPCAQPNWRCRQRSALEAAKHDTAQRKSG